MEPKDREHFIDEWLEGALKQRGMAEVRPGLEIRILASLKAERERAPMPAWSWRPVWVGLATILLIAGAALLRRTNEIVPPVASHVSAPAVSKSVEHRVAASARKPLTLSTRKSNTAPRLEQFPSPQPLSEQEEILARYLQQFPREAGLVAQAQTQLSKQEMIEQETSEQDQ
jgi:hypothetical protein